MSRDDRTADPRRARRRPGLVAAALVAALVVSSAPPAPSQRAGRPVTTVAAAWAAAPPLPTPVGLVSDFAGVIDAATERALTALLEELKQKTGAEIAVVTVRTTAPDTAFDYAMRLAEAWKPGARDKDNGVVLLAAVDDRDLFIATGYGIEGALPDGLVGEIRDREILPRFRAGDLAGGIRAGVERMAGIIAHEYGVTLAGVPPPRTAARRARDPEIVSPLVVTMLLIFFFIVLPILMNAFADPKRRRRGPWDSGPMWGGGFGGGGFGGPSGDFGGFGGGSFGGGGAGGKW